MKINIRKLLCNDQDTITFSKQIEKEILNVEDNLFHDDICVNGEISLNNHLLCVRYDIEMIVCLECSRCLDPVFQNVKAEYFEEITLEDIEIDEYNNINLYEVIVDSIFINIPVKVLCNENCEGLCPKCGINLNHNKCECNNMEIDLRLMDLQKLID
jgi:uncharacterized protein